MKGRYPIAARSRSFETACATASSPRRSARRPAAAEVLNAPTWPQDEAASATDRAGAVPARPVGVVLTVALAELPSLAVAAPTLHPSSLDRTGAAARAPSDAASVAATRMTGG